MREFVRVRVRLEEWFKPCQKKEENNTGWNSIFFTINQKFWNLSET